VFGQTSSPFLGGVWFRSEMEQSGSVPDSRNGMAPFYVW
jgi:hypothetical protein